MTAKRIISLWIILILAVVGVHAQQKITGMVTDPSGEPVIGAQVRWKDTKSATITAIDGSFSIERNEQSKTLVISYIGYKAQQINVAQKQTKVTVKMEDDAQNLD